MFIAMARQHSARSSGFLFAVLPLGGAIGLGGMEGEPVIGLLLGLGLAALLTALYWLVDIRR